MSGFSRTWSDVLGLGMRAVPDRRDVVGVANDTLREQKSSHEVAVAPWRTHGDNERRTAQAYLEGFLGNDAVVHAAGGRLFHPQKFYVPDRGDHDFCRCQPL